jgi:HD-GYP domain-containing protein (c-di-GMP phosphodiesterase class II)
VRASHERYDGSGYPDRLVAAEIPVGARVIAVCDAFDAMTSERSYSAPISVADALAKLQRCAGTQFDPHVVRVFLEVINTSEAMTEQAAQATGTGPRSNAARTPRCCSAAAAVVSSGDRPLLLSAESGHEM